MKFSYLIGKSSNIYNQCSKKIYIYNIRIYMSINNRFILVSILVCFALLLPLFNTKQLNSFNLLFPTAYQQSKGHVRHLVITSGGCYDWQSSNTNIVKVEGTHEGLAPLQSNRPNTNCDSNAIVEVSITGQYLSPVQISAKNLQTKQIMTIPVRMRSLKKISIFTKSRSMNVNQVQTLEIYGFDQENNTFTSLQGLRFSWNLVQQTDGSSGEVQFVNLESSKIYIPLDTRKKIENNGRAQKIYSDILLIKATKVGRVKIKVRCVEPSYSYVSYELSLFVQQKFTINPPSVLQIIAGSRFQYSLYTSSQQVIRLPSDNYVFELSNNNFKVYSNLQIQAPSMDSQTKLSVYDFRISPPYKEEVLIYSSKPDFIQISVSQAFVGGQQMEFEVKFYRNNKQLKGEVNPRLLHITVVESPSVPGFPVFSIDKTNRRIKALNKGYAVLSAEFQGLIGNKTVYSSTPVKVVSPEEVIILPVGEIYQMNVIGGSRSYKYSCNIQQQPIITLSLNGLITTRKEGIVQITVSDERNPNNKAKIQVRVEKISRLNGFEDRKQLNLYGDGTLYLGAQVQPIKIGQKQISQFTECNDALLKGLEIKNGEGKFVKEIEIHRVDQANSENLRQFQEMSEYSEEIARLLKKRQFHKWVQNYSIYLKYKQISQSQLQGLFKDFQNYGICAKVHIKAIEPYDGLIKIRKTFRVEYTPTTNNIQLRVYSLLQNNLRQSNNPNQVVLVPRSSFKWITKGGPHKWNSNQEFQVYLDGKKVEFQSSDDFSDYVYPTISCKRQQVNEQKHYLKYMNKKSSRLLRPVQQSIQIKLKCVEPKALRLGLPNKSSKLVNSKRILPQDLEALNYFIPKQQLSIVYLLPKQSFLFSVQPLFHQEVNDYKNHYFNSSSLVISTVSNESYKLKELTQLKSQFGQRNYLYDGCDHLGKNKVQEISIVVKEIIDQKTNQQHNLISPLIHRIRIIVLEQLRFDRGLDLSIPIQIVNVPSSYQIIKIQGVDQDRITVKCNEKYLRCSLISLSQIRVQSQQVQKSISTELIVRDQLALQNKEISIPVKIQAMSGIDLWIGSKKFVSSFKRDDGFRRIDKGKLQGNTWVFDGEQFAILVDLYTFSLESGKSEKQSLKKINPKLIEVNFDKIPSQKIEQTERFYDPYNDLTYIFFKIPKLFNAESSSKSFNAKFSVYIKQKDNQVITSNTVNLEIYNFLSISTPYGIIPLSKVPGKAILLEKITIMESCSGTISVTGGSEQIKVAVLLVKMTSDYFQVTQSQRNFSIQTLESTQKLQQKRLEQITGKEMNVLNLGIYLMNKYTNVEEQIYVIRLLIEVPPIQNIQIIGNDRLMSGNQIRYRVSFSEPLDSKQNQILKESCSLQYKWEVSSHSANLVSINSNSQRDSVNVKSALTQQKQKIKSSQAELIVNIYHKGGPLIGKTLKLIKIYQQSNITLIENSEGKSCSESDLLLIPPFSGLRLGSNIIVSKVGKDQNSRIQIGESNLIKSKQASQYPEIIMAQQNIVGKPIVTMPMYTKVLVSDICGVFIENTDGVILLNPKNFENLKGSNYLFHFYLIDCFGRRFSHFDYLNLQYRISTVNREIAFAYIQDLNKGLIKVNPYKLGQTKLIFQVFLRGVHKTKEIIPIQISIYIQPSQPISIHLGDYLKFKGPSALKEAWVSSNNRIVSINSKSGEAIGQQQGEASIKYGSMSTQVSVVKVIQLLQHNRQESGYTDNGFEYQLVYRGKIYNNLEDSSSIETKLKWTCQILGEQGKYLEVSPKLARKNGKDIVGCQIKRKMQELEIQRTIRYLKVVVTCQNSDKRFKFSKQFTEQIGESFIILTEKHINPKSPGFKDKKTAIITIQSSERLQKYQKGPSSDSIIQEQFSGNKYTITVDLSKYVDGEWRIRFVNPRTKQEDFVVISKDKISSQENNAINQSQRWKWTDFVVLIMAINFLLILLYQVFISNKNDKFKLS